MATITKRGSELAALLSPYIIITDEVREVCSLIARHATTHTAYATLDCNQGLRPHQEERVATIEARIRELVASLPLTPDGAITVKLGGDPRGFTVKLHVPNQPSAGNTWGLDGDFGV